MDGDVPRAVDQPRVNLGKVVVQGLSDCLLRCLKGGRFDQAHLELVARLVGFDAQEIGASRLDATGHERAEIVVLLVDALVDVATVVVAVDRDWAGNDLRVRVDVGDDLAVAEILPLSRFAVFQLFRRRHPRLIDPDPRAHHRIRELQVGGQKFGGVAAICEAEPVVWGSTGFGVVKVFQFVSASDHSEDLIGTAIREGDQNGLLWRIVWLGLEHDVALCRLGKHIDRDPEADLAHGRSSRWWSRDQLRESVVSVVVPLLCRPVSHGLNA